MLQGLYGIRAPRVERFVRATAESREVLLLRQSEGDLEIALYLPAIALERAPARREALTDDVFCQVVEGVSHFLYLADRARREVQVTQLELELQAEVDKFVVLVDALYERRSAQASVDVARGRVFDNVTFLHPAGSEHGDRYREAHKLASRFARRIERSIADGDIARLRRDLMRFFGASLREKVEMALAA
jgi:hypothetical protein